MEYFNFAAQTIPPILELVLVILLLRGPFKKYPLLLAYLLLTLLTIIAEVIISRSLGSSSELYRLVYWGDELAQDFLLFLMVIVFTYRAAEGSVLQKPLGKLLAMAIVIALSVPFVLGRSPFFSNRWFTFASQCLNFGATIMNLALWTALIGSKQRRSELLLVSVGLGVAVAGQSIFYGILLLVKSQGLRDVAYVLSTLTGIASLAIWCWAFRPIASEHTAGPSSSGLVTNP